MADKIHPEKPVLPLPFSRPVQVANLRPDGLPVKLVATVEDCAAIAAALGLPSVERLQAEFVLLPGKRGHVSVTGTVIGEAHQTCVVSLESFPVSVREDVELEFAPAPESSNIAVPTGSKAGAVQKSRKAPSQPEPAHSKHEADELDPPDLIIDGQIDVGALATEFLALGLDPFPRKPGVEFLYTDPADEIENPFAKLVKLVPKP